MRDKDLPESVAANLRVQEIVSLSALNALEADWDRLSLSEINPNVFTTFDWFREWTRFRLQHEQSGCYRPNVLVVKQNEKVVGIAPLVYKKMRFGVGFRKLQFATNHADYHDLMLGDSPENIFSAVDHFERTSREWDFIELWNIRDVAGSVERLTDALAKSRLQFSCFHETDRCPYMPITGPWAEMMKQHSRFMKRILRRCEGLTADGLRIRIVEDPQNEPELLQKLVALDSQKRVGGLPALPILAPHRDVFQSLFNRLGPKNWILVVLLERNDTVVACHLLYRCGKKLFGYFTAFDQEYASISPGTALIPTIIDYGYERGFDELDFLRGEETYKTRWTKGVHHNYRLLIWNRRWKSRLSAFAYIRRHGLSAHLRKGRTQI